MLAWFVGASTLVKSAVIIAAIAIAGSAIAVPTALVTASVVAHENVTASPSSAPTLQPSEPSNPTPTPTETSSPSASASSGSQQQAAKAPIVQAAEPAAPAPVVQPPAPADPAANLPGAPTGVFAFAGAGEAGSFTVNLDATPPANSGGSPISSYQLGYSLDNGASWNWAPTLAITDGTFHHVGTTYYRANVTDAAYLGGPNPLFCMRAVNSYGAGPRSNISQ